MVGNIDHVLATLNRHRVDYLLIGGVNFLLRHTAVLTYDIDVWIEDTSANRRRCEVALVELQAEWGRSDSDWGPVATKPKGWLEYQSVFCLTGPYGAIDIFRSVLGLDSWPTCLGRAEAGKTASGTAFLGLSDADMLRCQLALPEGARNEARVRFFRESLETGPR
jgi:hypothetical protein